MRDTPFKASPMASSKGSARPRATSRQAARCRRAVSVSTPSRSKMKAKEKRAMASSVKGQDEGLERQSAFGLGGAELHGLAAVLQRQARAFEQAVGAAGSCHHHFELGLGQAQ